MIQSIIDIPIYYGKFVIIFADNFEKVNELYKTKADDKLYDAVMFENTDNDEFIVAIKKVDWSVIAHEVVHVVNSLFLSRGIQLDRINDEPQAYMTGWFVKEIDKFINLNNLK